MRQIDTLVLHCSAGTGGFEAIEDWHKTGKGWSAIGYHYVVERDGRIVPGRPVARMGAHVGQPGNQHSIGICYIGGDLWNAKPATYLPPTPTQHSMLILLVNALRYTYWLGIDRVKGHREYPGVTKTCPGTGFNMDDFRAELSESLVRCVRR